MPTDLVMAALRNFRRTGSRWLMATHNPTIITRSNEEATIHAPSGLRFGEGGYRHLNLRLPPYNLPPPKWEFPDLQTRDPRYSPRDHGNRMAMWRLDELSIT